MTSGQKRTGKNQSFEFLPQFPKFQNHRENGGTLGMVALIINPHIHLIWVFILGMSLKGLLGGAKQLGYHLKGTTIFPMTESLVCLFLCCLILEINFSDQFSEESKLEFLTRKMCWYETWGDLLLFSPYYGWGFLIPWDPHWLLQTWKNVPEKSA